MADLRIAGGTLVIPTGAVNNEAVAAGAALDADKLQHLYKKGTTFDLAIGATPVAREEIVFVASTAGIIRGFHALLNDTGTTTDIDFDIKINGTTALSGLLNFTDADSDGAVKSGTLSTTVIAIDDIISIQMIITTSTGAQGPFAWLEVEELAA